jgi:NADH-quinone oxidoreductase subunit A
MPNDFLPILILFLVAGALAVLAIGVPSILGPHKPDPVKLAAYESGKIPLGNPRRPFSIKYYMFAMLFLLLDIVMVFMYLWAPLIRSLAVPGLLIMGAFLLFIIVGYVFVWRKGALEWD